MTETPTPPVSVPPAPSASALRRARRAFVLTAFAIPLAATIVGVTLTLAWLPQMPAEVAMHWNAGGPGDFAPAWLTPLLLAVVGTGVPVLLGVIGLVGSRGGEWGPVLRFLGAVSAGVTLFLVTLVTWLYGMQRGMTDAQEVPGAGLAIGVALGVGVVVGIAAWFLQPAVAVSGGPRSLAPAEMIALAPDERVAWLRTVTMPRGAMALLVGATLLLAALAVVFLATGIPIWWVLGLVSLVLLVLVLTTCVMRVRIDAAGLRVASVLGIPRFIVPLTDIASAEPVRVVPLAEFGGYGVRVAVDGRFGIVLRRGDAIQVTRRSGRVFVVTVEDAATGAAVLTALAAREGAKR